MIHFEFLFHHQFFYVVYKDVKFYMTIEIIISLYDLIVG